MGLLATQSRPRVFPSSSMTNDLVDVKFLIERLNVKLKLRRGGRKTNELERVLMCIRKWDDRVYACFINLIILFGSMVFGVKMFGY